MLYSGAGGTRGVVRVTKVMRTQSLDKINMCTIFYYNPQNDQKTKCQRSWWYDRKRPMVDDNLTHRYVRKSAQERSVDPL